MKSLLLSFFMVCSINAKSQIVLNKNIKICALLQFANGALHGTRDSYLFHYNDKHRNIGWKPNNEAWVNKWAKDQSGNVIVGTERFWGSSRWFVFTTDPYHALNFGKNRMNEGTVILYGLGELKTKSKKRKWYNYAIDSAIMFTAKSIGFYITYEVIFK